MTSICMHAALCCLLQSLMAASITFCGRLAGHVINKTLLQLIDVFHTIFIYSLLHNTLDLLNLLDLGIINI